ncbi:hypothetical protein DI09_12p80 [Mitosporidium daphniae]|uniref:Uncharacterized protein n=1 Tax=Mitosporidium daphniae TaxID=1485682 RepID=A0A098VVA1_9MICR|nr:uncharacterized protein DI09_12p80 [Mitosporidium daphniae]KGG52840.1 hypothetical protein DI09_12p80 [Mitosporidium daphniae]|eukprot:XP_013239312.1 uncharacterized protein DI09_12p80 [Mitosporidium daphniae]
MISLSSEQNQINNGNIHLSKKGKPHADQSALSLCSLGNSGNFFLTNPELCSKKEIFQLIAQFLDESGFHQISAQLKRETNINLPKMPSAELKEFLLSNAAAENARLLSSLDVDAIAIKVRPLALTEIQKINQFLSVQKYYDLLFHSEDLQALKHLRDEVLCYVVENISEYKRLFSLVFWVGDTPQLSNRLFGAGFLQKKEQLLVELDKLLPKEFLPSPNRLGALLAQAKTWKKHCEFYHDSAVHFGAFYFDSRLLTLHDKIISAWDINAIGYLQLGHSTGRAQLDGIPDFFDFAGLCCQPQNPICRVAGEMHSTVRLAEQNAA